jgi:eukaryotic-like serine/threonine-protein kinase
MQSSSSDRNPVELLAEEFLERHRRGERPSLEEYTAKHPELADEIRAAFPALLALEELKPPAGDATGPYAADANGRQPDRLGDYRILREVGRGGMGIVYEAEQLSLGRHVALKVLPGQVLLNPTYLERFRREARAAARLHHTNIVPVFGVGESDGLHYYAMQFIPGEGLDRVLRDLRRLRQHRPEPGTEPPEASGTARSESVAHSLLSGDFALPAVEAAAAPDLAPRLGSPSSSAVLSSGGPVSGYHRRVARIALQVADALAHAHRLGVLHRDVKPSNLLLDAQGTVWVTDFGLAKVHDSAELTTTGEVVGTRRYLAPERLHGQGDGRSDVYALGLTLYELLTLRPAFAGDGEQKQHLVSRILFEEPPRPRRLEPSIPRDLETIVLKATAKDPAQRYQSAAGMAEDLRRFLEDRPIRARRAGPVELLWRWCRRNPLVAALAAMVAVSLIAGTTASVLFALVLRQERDRADGEAAQAVKDRNLAKQKAGEAEASAAEAHRNLYAAHLNLAEDAWRDGQTGKVLRLLHQHEPAPGPAEDLRGFEWYLLDRWCHQDLRTFDGVRTAAFHPTAPRYLALLPTQGAAIRLWDTVEDREVRTFAGLTRTPQQVVFSADGKLLASASYGTGPLEPSEIRLWEVESGRELREFRGHTGMVWHLALSPDGTHLAAQASDGVWLWELAGTGEGRIVAGGRSSSGVSFSPDSRRLAFGSDRGIEIRDAATGRELQVLGNGKIQVSSVVFSPDGRLLASAGLGHLASLWDVASGQARHTLRGHTGPVRAVAFSPDGGLLASAGDDGMIKLWEVAEGRELFTLQGHADWVWQVVFGPDGRRLLSSGPNGPAKLWDLVDPRQLGIFRCLWPAGVAFSPDGEQLAARSGSGENHVARVWDVTTGQELVTLRHPTGQWNGLVFGPDGRRLAWAVSGQAITLWDPATGRDLLTLGGHAGRLITAVAASPDCRWLAVGSGEGEKFGEVKVWDTTSGQEQCTLRGHRDWMGSLCFSPDGRRLASVSLDKTVMVWEWGTGRELYTLSAHQGLVSGLAFSPDGGRLATAGWDHTARVWEAATGKPLLVLHGHTDIINGVTFGPDGRRLATASRDRTAKVWDAVSGQELLTLHGHTAEVGEVAFSPDGLRLATASWDGTLRVWDARPDTREVRDEREALGLLHGLFNRPLLKADVLEAVRADPCLSEVVRQKALAFAEQYHDEPDRFNTASWMVVRQAGLPAEKYQKALRAAEAACRLAPDNGHYLNTLGVAQYRAGNYEKALETLTRSEKLNATAERGPLPEDLAFLAMTQQQLGQKEQAKASLQRLRNALKNPAASGNEEAQAFLHDAERLIEGQASSPEK